MTTRYTKYDADTGVIEYTFGGKGGDLECNEPYIEGEYSGDEYVVVDGEAVRKPESEIKSFQDSRLLVGIINMRNGLLSESDYTQGTDAPLTVEQKAEWATYRQALRDLPENIEDLANPVWPIPPS